ncbi:MAG: T9SS type A sorting domain-containing protein, partial [Muribaculaceae bacterium]
VVLLDASNTIVASSYNSFEIIKGNTVTSSIVGELTDVAAGSYTLAICNLIDENTLQTMASTNVTVSEEPEAYNLTNQGFVFGEEIIADNFRVTCNVKNTGGLYGGTFTALVTCGGTSVAQFNSGYYLIDKDVTMPVEFATSIDGSLGETYKIYLFIKENGSWVQIGSGTQFRFTILTGIEDVKADAAAEVVVYPNPADDVVYVQSPSAMGSINVFSLSGKQVIVANAEGAQSTSLQVDNLPSGVYVIKITTDEGVAVRRMIKK